MRFFLTTLASLVISIHAAAHETNKSNERDISTYVLPTCIKPKTNPSFDYVECLNKKDVARVGNIIQTPLGDFPYPLGLVDKDGKVVLANEYHQIDFPGDWEWDNFSPTSDALILVTKRDLANNPMFGNLGVNELYGLINPQGTFIVPFGQYDEINPFYDNGLASVAKDGKYGFIDTKGNVAIPLIYDYAYHFDNGFANVKYQGKYGVIDTKNSIVIDFSYQHVKILDNLDDIYFAIKSNDKHALFDQQKQLTDFSYNMIDVIYFSKLFIVGNQGKYGVIDHAGKLIVPIQYDYIYNSLTSTYDDNSNTYIEASQGDKHHHFDTKGNLILAD